MTNNSNTQGQGSQRCAWCSAGPAYIDYHDTEWGVPSRDPRHLFEMLILEGFQAGLSWITILHKRPAFRQAMFNFDVNLLAAADDAWLESNMQNSAIIRNRLKLKSAITNAQAWLRLPDPVGLIWSVVNNQPKINHYKHHSDMPTAGSEAESLSRILKQHGFKFVGPTICQSYLQAIGCLMDHTIDCYRYAELSNPT